MNESYFIFWNLLAVFYWVSLVLDPRGRLVGFGGKVSAREEFEDNDGGILG